MSVFVALREKGLPFKLLTVDLAAGANRAPEFATTSLTQRVPVLVHRDLALSESSAITEYIDDVFPGPHLYPVDPKLRARARQIQAWLRSDLLPIRIERPTDVLFYGPSSVPLSAASRAAAEKLFMAADVMIESSAENVFGDWCLADLDLAVMLNRLVMNGDPVPEKLADYALRQWQRLSAQQWVGLERR